MALSKQHSERLSEYTLEMAELTSKYFDYKAGVHLSLQDGGV